MRYILYYQSIVAYTRYNPEMYQRVNSDTYSIINKWYYSQTYKSLPYDTDEYGSIIINKQIYDEYSEEPFKPSQDSHPSRNHRTTDKSDSNTRNNRSTSLRPSTQIFTRCSTQLNTKNNDSLKTKNKINYNATKPPIITHKGQKFIAVADDERWLIEIWYEYSYITNSKHMPLQQVKKNNVFYVPKNIYDLYQEAKYIIENTKPLSTIYWSRYHEINEWYKSKNQGKELYFIQIPNQGPSIDKAIYDEYHNEQISKSHRVIDNIEFDNINKWYQRMHHHNVPCQVYDDEHPKISTKIYDEYMNYQKYLNNESAKHNEESIPQNESQLTLLSISNNDSQSSLCPSNHDSFRALNPTLVKSQEPTNTPDAAPHPSDSNNATLWVGFSLILATLVYAASNKSEPKNPQKPKQLTKANNNHIPSTQSNTPIINNTVPVSTLSNKQSISHNHKPIISNKQSISHKHQPIISHNNKQSNVAKVRILNKLSKLKSLTR